MMRGSPKYGVALLAAAGLLGAGCSSPRPARPSDPDLERYAGSAQVSFRHGEYRQAEQLYRRALDRARAADNALEIGNNAFNLAVCLVTMDRDEEARPFLREARAELERAGENTTETILLEATAARKSGRAEESAALVAEARARLKSGRDRSLLVQATLIEAQLACDRGDSPQAALVLESVARDLKRVDDPLIRGRFAGLQARVAWMTAQPGACAAWLDEEAAWYRKAGGRPQELAAVLRRAGEAWAQAGGYREAADRYYRAARSMYAQGDTVAALKCIEPALSAAQQAEAPELFRQITVLFEEIGRKVGETREKTDPGTK
ncbi:MAG: tetratricopeptide repeat protein [Verrucomicrobia bacterium]|nr:tetratricopeptide repeat protein [Verrucomicrobiota bacterium]